MTQFLCFAAGLAIAAAVTPLKAAAPDLSAESVRVGRNLQAYTSIRLSKPAPPGGLELTIVSDDPGRLLLSKTQDGVSSSSITLKLPAQAFRTPDFSLRALASSGSVNFTMSAPGLESAKGEVTLAPSAIVIVGPFKAARFPTTPRGEPAKFNFISVALDSTGKIAEQQDIAGASPVDVEISNSNPGAIKLQQSRIQLAAGTGAAGSGFRPAAVGDAVIGPVQPPGFAVPAEMASITVAVALPSLAISGDIYLGKDLQTPAPLILGDPAPAGGVSVTLKSSDSSRLVLSAGEDQPGAGSITIAIPEGQRNGAYYIQALGDSGQVDYTASAPGYVSKTGTVALARSGMLIADESYGPPDESNVKRKIGAHPDREFFVSLAEAKANPVRLVVWTAYIDPESGRSADFTVQPLRAGVDARVVVKSSDPAVATVESPLMIKQGFNRAICTFTPLKPGKTTISLEMPSGFTSPQNGFLVPVTVKE